MFFILSKILHFLIIPSTWIFALLLLALMTKNGRRRKRALVGASLVFFIFGNCFIFDEATRAWEIDAIELSEGEKYEYGIVLSGMTRYDPSFDRINFQANIDRLLQALPLHSEGKIDSLIISGGDGSIRQDQDKEAAALYHYLGRINYDLSKILLEPNSKNTFENAAFTKKKLLEKGVNLEKKKVLLVTSALHMRRSLTCFKQQGITCTPYVTNRIGGARKFDLDHLLIPSAHTLGLWEALNHEVTGFLMYKIMGYI